MGVYFSSSRLHLLSLAAPLWFCLLPLILFPYMGLQKWTLGCYKTSTQQKPLRCLRANVVGWAADLNHDVFFSVVLYNRNDYQSPKCQNVTKKDGHKWCMVLFTLSTFLLNWLDYSWLYFTCLDFFFFLLHRSPLWTISVSVYLPNG